MFFNNFVGFRCRKQLYNDFKKALKKNPEIESVGQGLRVAMIHYIREIERQSKWS